MTYDERKALALEISIAQDLSKTIRSLSRWRNPAEYDRAEREVLAAIERIVKQLGKPTT